MQTTHSHSSVIEQMRQQRQAWLSCRNVEAPPHAPHQDVSTMSGLGSRLGCLNANECVTRSLGVDDPVDTMAVLQEIEILLTRVGYHWRSALVQKAGRNRRSERWSRALQPSPKRRGRPANAQNFAARQLGLGLALIWSEQTRRPPSRYESTTKVTHRSYTAFVAAIAAVVPMLFRKTVPSALPDVEYLVRTSIRDYRAAMAAPDEYRRRGLIDEQLWLHVPSDDAQQLTQP
jgi:hypothetical protein